MNKSILEKQYNKLKTKGILTINEDFTDLMMQRIYFDILDISRNNNIKFLTIYINSRGGSVDSLFPIIDLLNQYNKPISTIVMGKAYSCGALLLLSGTKKLRFAHKHSEILLHEVAGKTIDKNKQIQENAKWINRINKSFKLIIKEKTKMTNEQIDKYMESNLDIFLTSNQALHYGIIDKII